MELKEMKVIAGAILVGLVAFAVWSVFTKEVGATSIGTKWVNEGDVKWGECQTEVKTACGNVEGTQYGEQKQRCKLTQGGGFTCVVGHTRNVEVSQSCVVEGPVCEEEPVDTCESEEGIQENGCTPVEEPETPPVVKKGKSNHESCDAPSRIQGFRFQFVPEGNRLRWSEKSGVSKVDIRVYGPDKVTKLYDVRTEDDGEYIIGRRDTWHKIRSVDEKCGLSEWSKLIN